MERMARSFRQKRILVFCDYHPGLLDSMSQTLDHIGVTLRVLVRKRHVFYWKDIRTRVINLPLRVFFEEEPVTIPSIISLITYLITATIVGTIVVVRQRLEAILAIFAFPQGTVAFLVGLITRRKVAILTDGGDIDVLLKRALLRPIMLMCLRRATVVGALNNTKSSLLLSHGIKTRLCPTIGIDTSRFEYVPNRGQEFLILYAGRLIAEKRPELLLKACYGLKQRGACFKVLLAGDGPLREEIANGVIQMGLADIVTMKGYVPHSEMHDLFQESAVLVLPSAREGVSVSLLEAMSSGCVCIVSDIADNKELIQDKYNGITFRADDQEDLTDELYWAMSHPVEMESMAKNARRLVEREYSLDAVGSKLSAVLSSL